MPFAILLITLFFHCGISFAEDPPKTLNDHGKAENKDLVKPDPRAAQLFKCFAGIKKAGGLPERIETQEKNWGRSNFVEGIS